MGKGSRPLGVDVMKKSLRRGSGSSSCAGLLLGETCWPPAQARPVGRGPRSARQAAPRRRGPKRWAKLPRTRLEARGDTAA
eukprot:5903731-Pyramimonas_sp.AAC.1